MLVRFMLVLLFCAGTTVFVRFVMFEWNENRLYAVLSRIGGSSDTLIVADRIFVISLARRTDRRIQMERLRRALGARWDYVDATDASDGKVANILSHVRWQRAQQGEDFRWPDDIDSLVASEDVLKHAGSDLWATNEAPNYLGPSQAQAVDSLVCATDDDTVLPYISDLPEYRILSPAKLACWYSHWSLIHRIANAKQPGVTIILEDDVDMEKDIRERLRSAWSLLPVGWDIVFLGHCWSNETQQPALLSADYQPSQLHPSSAPKCTHAYALSRSGARRLWLHLRYAPFAYSRAIDQAYAWLVAEGRLASYSIVPSVVTQQKSLGSDVMSGNGSEWRETLENAVLGNSTAGSL